MTDSWSFIEGGAAEFILHCTSLPAKGCTCLWFLFWDTPLKRGMELRSLIVITKNTFKPLYRTANGGVVHCQPGFTLRKIGS